MNQKQPSDARSFLNGGTMSRTSPTGHLRHPPGLRSAGKRIRLVSGVGGRPVQKGDRDTAPELRVLMTLRPVVTPVLATDSSAGRRRTPTLPQLDARRCQLRMLQIWGEPPASALSTCCFSIAAPLSSAASWIEIFSSLLKKRPLTADRIRSRKTDFRLGHASDILAKRVL